MDFIIDNFNMLFDSEEGLKKLDEMILDLAVKGKLVEQDSNDEPASVLIEKIKEEKKKLIAEKKIRKPKKIELISEEEIPFKIPVSWEWVRLGEVTLISSGKSFKSEEFNKTSGTRVIKITNVGVKKIKVTNDFLPDDFKEKNQEFLILKDDIILALTRPYIKDGLKVCKCPTSYNNSLLNQRVATIKNKYKLNNDYIFNYLTSDYILSIYKNKFERQGLQPNLRINDVTDLFIPLPPLEEQKRIVAKIDSLKKLIENLKIQVQIREKTRDGLKKSIMAEIEKSSENKDLLKNLELVFQNFDIVVKKKEDIKDIRDLVLSMAVKGKLVEQDPNDEPANLLIEKIKIEKKKLIAEKKIKKPKELEIISEEEKPFGLPESWEWVRLGDQILSFQNGISKRSAKEGSEKVIVRLSDISNYKIDIKDPRSIKLSKEEIVKYNLQKDDILITRVNGSPDIVGRFNLIEKDEDIYYCDHFIRIRLSEKTLRSPYLFILANSDFTRQKIGNLFLSTTGQKTVNQKHISNLLIPLPPLAEQKRIVERVDKLMELCDRLEEQVEKSQKEMKALMGSVMQLGSGQ